MYYRCPFWLWGETGTSTLRQFSVFIPGNTQITSKILIRILLVEPTEATT